VFFKQIKPLEQAAEAPETVKGAVDSLELKPRLSTSAHALRSSLFFFPPQVLNSHETYAEKLPIEYMRKFLTPQES
jgi:hypothetical protein